MNSWFICILLWECIKCKQTAFCQPFYFIIYISQFWWMGKKNRDFKYRGQCSRNSFIWSLEKEVEWHDSTFWSFSFGFSASVSASSECLRWGYFGKFQKLFPGNGVVLATIQMSLHGSRRKEGIWNHSAALARSGYSGSFQRCTNGCHCFLSLSPLVGDAKSWEIDAEWLHLLLAAAALESLLERTSRMPSAFSVM